MARHQMIRKSFLGETFLRKSIGLSLLQLQKGCLKLIGESTALSKLKPCAVEKQRDTTWKGKKLEYLPGLFFVYQGGNKIYVYIHCAYRPFAL